MVRDLAAGLSLPFRSLRVEVAPEGSLQGKARDARYEALLGLARSEGATRVAVGHSQDDQAETVPDRLLRGASVRGLAGIEAKRLDGVIRPLIDVRRSDVVAHLEHHGLEFIEDPSNQDPRFTRVRIRRELLPMLAAEDPAVVSHLAQLADDARATRALVHRVGQELLAAARRPGGLDAAKLAGGDAAARREALRCFLEEAMGVAPRRAHLVSVDQLVGGAGSADRGPRGEVRLPHHLVARLDGKILTISERLDSREPTPREE
ncbi:MAG: tRNA lysidine(34) synthetase TilS [Deltaproteobacteria bacterium]|nr:MAG: tRNA lysidine(34) synthetase TilS [Deltaproteobacteria bacterium]